MRFSRKKTENERVADRIKTEKIDFSGLFCNLASRDEAAFLFKELAVLLHPDRYAGEDKIIIESAELLFKELQSCRMDINKLNNLKKKASLFLSKRKSFKNEM